MKFSRAFLFASLFFLGACTRTSEAPSTTEVDAPVMGMPVPGMENVEEMNVTEDAGGNGGVVQSSRTVRVDVTDWAFTPNAIAFKKGEQVVLAFTGVSGMHGVAIPDLGVQSAKFGPGDTVTLAVHTNNVGTFSFRCNVPCGSGHRDMTGTIVIGE